MQPLTAGVIALGAVPECNRNKAFESSFWKDN